MTKQTFIVYSLPRSGSAWLSQFLSWKDCFCYHEPFADGDEMDLYLKFQNRKEPVVGAVDTSIFFNPPNLQGVKEFVLIRDTKEIEKSARGIGLFVKDVEADQRKMMLACPQAEPIFFDKLFNIAYLQKLWKRIVGNGSNFDIERAGYMIEMNIQRNVEMVTSRYLATRAEK